MPTYEYECPKCHKHIDIVAKITETSTAPICVEPGCDGQQEMVRVFSPTPSVFHGSGWTPKHYK